jgi:hypothetical protein
MQALADQICELDGIEVYGPAIGVRGLMVDVAEPIHIMSVGASHHQPRPGGAPQHSLRTSPAPGLLMRSNERALMRPGWPPI